MTSVSKKDKNYIVKNILLILPGVKIVAFGSRIRGGAKKYSDLDLGIFQEEKISLGSLSKISEFFSESSLPYKIDIVDGARVDEEFKKMILDTGEVWV